MASSGTNESTRTIRSGGGPVGKRGFEPLRLVAHDPKSCASASSATSPRTAEYTRGTTKPRSQGAGLRATGRRGRDSNPRDPGGSTRFPGARTRPGYATSPVVGARRRARRALVDVLDDHQLLFRRAVAVTVDLDDR